MKIKEGFVVRKLASQYVVVALFGEASKLNYLIKLNTLGVFLWNSLSKDLTEEELVKLVLDKYDVEESIARKDVHDFVTVLRERSLINE